MNDETEHQEAEGNDSGAAVDPTELASIAAELGDAEQAETEAEQGEQVGPSTSEVLYPLISFGCDLGCPNWQIQDAEKQGLAEGYADLIDKYWPGGIGQFGVELNALLMTAAIFGPRVAKGIPARIEKEVERKPETSDGEQRADAD